MQTSGRDAWRPREVAGGKIRKIPLPAVPAGRFLRPAPTAAPSLPGHRQPSARPFPDHPTGRGRPFFLLPTTRRRPLAKLRPATLRPTFRRPAASHRPSAAPLPAADPSPSRCRTAARRANAARTCFCLFLRAACTIFVALPGPHLARPLHGRPGAGHKPLSPA